MASSSVRVRFAPSPSGYLHIGGARTALFNYLFARKHGGTLVLRVEDTDRQRSTPEAIAAILDGMRYLGLDWDEGPAAEGEGEGGDCGPYFQSERVESYVRFVDRLLDEGKAYRCFCSKERLTEVREAQRQAKERLLYDRRCLALDPTEAEKRTAAGEPSVVRFRIPEGQTVVEDLIRGDVTFRHEEIEDLIIQRSDGTCVYNLAVVGDDHEMGVTHVIRGEDHLSNTPKQILLLQALGFSLPVYAHIPLILGPGGGKLSKRHGAVSVTEYEEKGYLPEAMINFLARMGWSFDDKEEIFSREDLIEKFSLESVSKSGAVYDLKKLDHLGGHYIRKRPVSEIVELALPHIVRAGLISDADMQSDRARLEAMIALEHERMSYVGQIVEKVRYYFEEPECFEDAAVELDKGAKKALRKKKDMAPALKKYAESLEQAISEDAWIPGEHEALENHAKEFIAAEGIGLGDLAQPARVVLTGRSATPGLFEVMSVLGREMCLRRLRRTDEVFALVSDSS